jgi:hypothetical protein
MSIVEFDESTVRHFYCGTGTADPKWLIEDHIQGSGNEGIYVFLVQIKDLSEEFHRKYSRFYKTIQWANVFCHQIKLSDKFYDDFFYKINVVGFVEIIKNNRVSSKWIEKNFYRIPPEVWVKVYE